MKKIILILIMIMPCFSYSYKLYDFNEPKHDQMVKFQRQNLLLNRKDLEKIASLFYSLKKEERSKASVERMMSKTEFSSPKVKAYVLKLAISTDQANKDCKIKLNMKASDTRPSRAYQKCMISDVLDLMNQQAEEAGLGYGVTESSFLKVGINESTAVKINIGSQSGQAPSNLTKAKSHQ